MEPITRELRFPPEIAALTCQPQKLLDFWEAKIKKHCNELGTGNPPLAVVYVEHNAALEIVMPFDNETEKAAHFETLAYFIKVTEALGAIMIFECAMAIIPKGQELGAKSVSERPDAIDGIILSYEDKNHYMVRAFKIVKDGENTTLERINETGDDIKSHTWGSLQLFEHVTH